MDLYTRLRTRHVLHLAWTQVKRNGFASDSPRTREQVRQFEATWATGLERIRDRLKKGTFDFAGEVGITPPKKRGGAGARPIVLAPVVNRIVRRALLDVLQGYGNDGVPARHRWNGVDQVRAVLETPTSVGGIRRRGVSVGIALVVNAVENKSSFFVRSDIRNFFTRIPKPAINHFIRQAVCNDEVARLFASALDTNLENRAELEERKAFVLFPSQEVGVAQGSALSALAGNIALRDFDTRMNGRDITCVRYIDDFILLGPTEAKVRAAYNSVRTWLKAEGMDVYDPNDSIARAEGKVDQGNIHSGTDFLGYRISGLALQPAKAARKKFLAKLDAVIARAAAGIAMRARGERTELPSYHEAIVEMDKIVWGWSQAFRRTNVPHYWDAVDQDIDQKLLQLAGVHEKASSTSDHSKRRLRGVGLLADYATYSAINAEELKDVVTFIAAMDRVRRAKLQLDPLPSGSDSNVDP